jgi:hypothetical protein
MRLRNPRRAQLPQRMKADVADLKHAVGNRRACDGDSG